MNRRGIGADWMENLLVILLSVVLIVGALILLTFVSSTRTTTITAHSQAISTDNVLLGYMRSPAPGSDGSLAEGISVSSSSKVNRNQLTGAIRRQLDRGVFQDTGYVYVFASKVDSENMPTGSLPAGFDWELFELTTASQIGPAASVQLPSFTKTPLEATLFKYSQQ